MSGKREPLQVGRIAFAKEICIDWFSSHSKSVLLSCLFSIPLAFCLYQVGMKLSGGKADRFKSDSVYKNWISSEAQDPELFKKVQKYPELEVKFGGQIAQRLLTFHEPVKAEHYVKELFAKTRGMTAPYYGRFSKNSLLISQGKYQEALAEALKMKAQMEADDAFWQGQDAHARSGTALYAYNLLRIASLQCQLGSKEGELAAWNELLHNGGWDGALGRTKMYDPEVYSMLAQNFQEGSLSLLEFIEQRKKVLSGN